MTNPHLDSEFDISKVRQRLGLVFDCTCPDRDCWSAARRLMFDPASRVVGQSQYEGKAARRERAPAQLNADIRQGLAAAFRDRFGRPVEDRRDKPAGSLAIHLAWFADGEGEGVASLEGLEMPIALWGDRGTVPAVELGDLLQRCTYSPGLDVWDPLEEALQIVAAPLLHDPQPGSGILIVGNSPPNMPLLADSPFWKLLDREGMPTTTRRKTTLFTSLVRALDSAGIPLVYLFLTHDRCADEQGRDFQVFDDIQSEVRDALAAYMPVVRRPADGPGIADGLTEVLGYLERPAVSAATVRDRRNPEGEGSPLIP
jgi:hypothetical protein